MSAAPRRLRLYVTAPRSPSPVNTRPCAIRLVAASFRASQVIEPIVPGHEEEPERVAPLAFRQQERELPGHGQARAVVVRERGMTRVRRHQDLAVGRARKDELAVRQGAAIVERRVDADLVLAVVERRGLVGRQAEPPCAGVVGRPVRDPGRSVRERVQVLAQLGERHAPVDGFAVADDVQVVRRGVDDPRPVGAPRSTRRAGSTRAARSSRARPCRTAPRAPRSAGRGRARRAWPEHRRR